MGKVKPISDVKALPKWQKYTIIAILFLLAASFTISGAMVAVIGTLTKSSNPPMGVIGKNEIKVDEFRKYIFFFEYYGQTEEALALLFAKFPVVTGSGEIKTKTNLRDSYYFDFLLEQVVNENPEMKEEELRSKFVNTLVWHHLMLLELAKLDNIKISEVDAAEKARLIVVGKPDLKDSSRNEGDNAGQNAENETEESSSETQEKILEQISEREALYVSRCSEKQLKPADVEKIVGEFVAVQKYMNKLIADNVSVSFEDALKNIKTFKNEIRLQYLRINSQHPEIAKRTKEKLADEIALTAIKRNLWESSNQMSGEELFENPLIKIYKRKITGEERNYHEPEYRFIVVSADFEKMQSFVRLTDEMVENFYEHYKAVFFENDKSETDISQIIDEQKKEFIKANKPADFDKKAEEKKPEEKKPEASKPDEKKPEGEEAAKVEWAPEGGWSKWRKPIYDKLRYKTFQEVKEEAKALAVKLAAPKLAESAVKKITDEINKRIAKNTETLTAEKNRRNDILMQYRNFENFFNGSKDFKGLFPSLSNFKKIIEAEITGMKNRCSLDITTENFFAEEIEAKVVQEAFNIAWDKISKLGWQQILKELKITVNPLAIQDNNVADVQNEIRAIEEDIRQLGLRTDLSALDELNKRTEILKITHQRLKILVLMRKELMNLYKALSEQFLESERFMNLFDKNFKLTKGYVETYFDKIEMKVNGFFSDFKINTNFEKTVEDLKLNVRELEISYKLFESELDEKAKNLSAELPPEKLLKINIEGIPFEQYGLETWTIEKSEFYKGVNIEGMWGASIPPFEYKRGFTMRELKNAQILKDNLSFLMNTKEWNFDKHTPEGSSFELAIKNMSAGSYSKALGATGIGLYLIFMVEKAIKVAPTFDEVKEEIEKEYIREKSPEAGEEYANEILRALRKNINEIKGYSFGNLVELCKKYSADVSFKQIIDEVSGLEAQTSKSLINKLQLSKKMRIALIQKEFKNIAEANNLELRETDFINYSSDIADISYEGGSDNLLIREALNLEPLIELGSVGKETKGDPDTEGETRTSYLIYRIIDEREGQLKGSDIHLNEISEEELELLKLNLWAQKVINNDDISKVKELSRLMKTLESKQIKVQRYYENEKDVEVDKGDLD